jgi:hypothetical protein
VTALLELCSLIRSKNAGPFVLTFDFMARDESTYAELVEHPLLVPATFAKLYGVAEETVRLQAHATAMAVKVSIPRPVTQGSAGDRDCYGGQYAAAILDADRSAKHDTTAGPGSATPASASR